ncbi:MAG: cytochrome c [Bacteroidales bacterium]|nr:cytochrome c [Bacteroidales bacterium]
MKKSVYILALLVFSVAATAMMTPKKMFNFNIGQTDEWVAPKSADNNKNPFSGNEEAAKFGKKLYKQNCAICHGNKGMGDGLAGMSLKPKPTNLTTENFNKQSDGAIFWKLTEGNSPMPSYKKTFTEKQRWQVVTYLREIKK